MRMIFKDDVLYVDIEGSMEIGELNIVKSRIFSILEQYEVENVVVNTKNIFNLSKKNINSFINEYYTKYNGNISIDN